MPPRIRTVTVPTATRSVSELQCKDRETPQPKPSIKGVARPVIHAQTRKRDVDHINRTPKSLEILRKRVSERENQLASDRPPIPKRHRTGPIEPSDSDDGNRCTVPKSLDRSPKDLSDKFCILGVMTDLNNQEKRMKTMEQEMAKYRSNHKKLKSDFDEEKKKSVKQRDSAESFSRLQKSLNDLKAESSNSVTVAVSKWGLGLRKEMKNEVALVETKQTSHEQRVQETLKEVGERIGEIQNSAAEKVDRMVFNLTKKIAKIEHDVESFKDEVRNTATKVDQALGNLQKHLKQHEEGQEKSQKQLDEVERRLRLELSWKQTAEEQENRANDMIAKWHEVIDEKLKTYTSETEIRFENLNQSLLAYPTQSTLDTLRDDLEKRIISGDVSALRKCYQQTEVQTVAAVQYILLHGIKSINPRHSLSAARNEPSEPTKHRNQSQVASVRRETAHQRPHPRRLPDMVGSRVTPQLSRHPGSFPDGICSLSSPPCASGSRSSAMTRGSVLQNPIQIPDGIENAPRGPARRHSTDISRRPTGRFDTPLA